MHELTATNTLFKPKHTRALETFLQTKKSESTVDDDFGEFIGAKVKAKYKQR